MKPSQAAVDLVKRHEGLRLDAYCCPAGLLTIGYGHTRGVHTGQHITPEFAEALLREDLEECARDVSLALHVPVTQAQFDALVSFAYNCGTGNLKSSRLLAKINQGRPAADEFLKWDHVDGKVLPGLTARRKAERELFLS